MRMIKKFEPLSVMKISAICYGALGLLEGVLFGVMFSMIPLTAHGNENLPKVFGPLFGVWAVIICSVLFAVMGAVMAGVGAAIYNVSARFVGGIEVEVE